MRLLRSPVFRGEGVPRGDGSPVLTIPGFGGNDATLAPMRAWLMRIGYSPRAAGLAFNVDCSERTLEHLERRLLRLVDESRGTPAALIGHSRGGQLARALAAKRPNLVTQVVALGSGLGDPFKISSSLWPGVLLTRAYHRTTTDRRRGRGCLSNDCSCSYGRHYRSPLPADISLVSVRAGRDAFMHQDACLVAGAENVKVDTTHVGLAVNPETYRVIAKALAKPRVAYADAA